DNVSWSSPIHGVRTNAGWQFSGDGLNIEAETLVYLRFRGYFPSGIYNGSGSVVETIQQVYLAKDDSGFCVPIKVSGGGVAVICL
ncbi:MAG: hypothetical protein ACKE8R_07845, partial [Methylophagaceae bacterium]